MIVARAPRYMTARRCQDCGRILFPTREGLWPKHFNLNWDFKDAVWCATSGTEVTI